MQKSCKFETLALVSILFALLFVCLPNVIAGEDVEFTGKFETALIPNAEDLEDVVFKPIERSKLKMEKPIGEGVKSVTAGRLYHAPQDKLSILAVLIEVEDKSPVIYADLDLNGTLAENERFEFQPEEPRNPYDWKLTLQVSFKGVLFQTFPLYLEYVKNLKTEEMTSDERLIQFSTEAFARGKVTVKDRDVLVQYGYKPKAKKLSPTTGWLGVDTDGNGEIEMDGLTPEAAKADAETVVFRIGQMYVSTKKADLEQNLIVMREHQAEDYKRKNCEWGKRCRILSIPILKAKNASCRSFAANMF